MHSMKSCKFLAPILFALLLTCASPLAQAQTYKVLHTFTGYPSDGDEPRGTLVRDGLGNLYGTTAIGGSGNCNLSPGCGTVFMLNRGGEELGIFSFSNEDGRLPYAGLFRDRAGNLYGTTAAGGVECPGNEGCGTVFQLNKTGNKIRNYSFAGQPDGANPEAPVIEVSGSLYSTTARGGPLDYGTVYRISPNGEETVVYNFEGSKGCLPYGGITADAKGNLYGATSSSGPRCLRNVGVAYELDTERNFKVLFTFNSVVGWDPLSPLIFDSQGNLYGTAESGGSNLYGTVFELSPQSNGTWSGTALYSFCQLPNCADGRMPLGSLVRDAAGNVYGTTFYGGMYNNCLSGIGCGVIFKLDTSGNETVLHNFTGGSDGAFPEARLIMDASGNLYGVASQGGDASCAPPYGCGVVFELTP